jgi:hypothetical protein
MDAVKLYTITYVYALAISHGFEPIKTRPQGPLLARIIPR